MNEFDHTGPQGAPGTPGVQGVQGVAGVIGIQGIQGVQGDTTSLTLEVGKAVGAIGVLVGEVAALRTDVSTANVQLAESGERMQKIEDGVTQLTEQVSIANGRTTKMETEQGKFKARMTTIESKWDSITFVPRMVDKLAEHKVLGLLFTVPLTSALTVVALHIFT